MGRQRLPTLMTRLSQDEALLLSVATGRLRVDAVRVRVSGDHEVPAHLPLGGGLACQAEKLAWVVALLSLLVSAQVRTIVRYYP